MNECRGGKNSETLCWNSGHVNGNKISLCRDICVHCVHCFHNMLYVYMICSTVRKITHYLKYIAHTKTQSGHSLFQQASPLKTVSIGVSTLPIRITSQTNIAHYIFILTQFDILFAPHRLQKTVSTGVIQSLFIYNVNLISVTGFIKRVDWWVGGLGWLC